MNSDFPENLDPVRFRMVQAMVERLHSPEAMHWREATAREIQARMARGDFDEEAGPDGGIAVREPGPRGPRDPLRGAHADLPAGPGAQRR